MILCLRLGFVLLGLDWVVRLRLGWDMDLIMGLIK